MVPPPLYLDKRDHFGLRKRSLKPASIECLISRGIIVQGSAAGRLTIILN